MHKETRPVAGPRGVHPGEAKLHKIRCRLNPAERMDRYELATVIVGFAAVVTAIVTAHPAFVIRMAEIVAGTELAAILRTTVALVSAFWVETMASVAVAATVFEAIVEAHAQAWIFAAVVIAIMISVAVVIAVGWGRFLSERGDAGTTRKRKRNK